MKRYGVKVFEKIIEIKVSRIKGKKYVAKVKHLITKKERNIHFGAINYEQFKDSTKIKKYKNKDHGNVSRKRSYFSRHSGERLKRDAVIKELKKSKGLYNAKILSHIYLW